MATAQIVASMAAFDMGSGEDFIEYSERFGMYLLANSITDGNIKRAVFLATIGGPAYKLLRSLLGETVKTATYDELVKALQEHLQPEPNMIAERFRFFKRDRKQGESVNDYVAELRRLSEHCVFGPTLNDYLRDRFVCGLGSESIQQKLLTVKDLTLDKALDIARGYESASRDAKLIRAGGGGGGVGAVTVHQAEPAEGENVYRLQPHQQQQKKQPNKRQGDTRECYRCGNAGHLAATCPYSTYSCRRCNKVGHLEKRCHMKMPTPAAQSKPAAIRKVCACHTFQENCGNVEGEVDQFSLDPLNLFVLEKQVAAEPVMVEVLMNGRSVRMEVDTGAAVSVMSLSNYDRVRNDQQLKKSDLRLKTYTGEIVRPCGVGEVSVEYQKQKRNLPITVVEGNVPNLLGRDWLSQLKLQWEELFPLERRMHKLEGVDGPIAELVKEYPEVFTGQLGCLKDFKVRIPVPEGTQPKFCRARPVPYAMKGRVDAELDRLDEQGVWQRVQYAKWAAPMVAVLKDPRDPTGPIRICGDYKQTVNKVAPLDSYPIPSTIDQLATLAGGEKFTKLDLSQAYQQLELDEDSRELLTINTHQGLFQPSRLQFGVHSATGIFQREMDRRLQRIPMTKVRVDDILISGRNDAEHLSNLRKVLEKLKEAGLTVCLAKCAFMQDEVTYCGYVINKHGVKPMPDNVEAVEEAPAPTNTSELRSFLGMVNYYNNYLSGLSTIGEPLHALMRKEVSWKWSGECEAAFQAIKRKLCSAPLLVHFDMSKAIVVHCDASAYGVGVVLSHIMDDGSERPVSFASRTLTMAERNYSVIEKEGLALVFAVKKFHQFLFGNKFSMYTDHKPLLGLFSESSPLPARAAARVMRWALLLSAYNYQLLYREGARNGNADALSRLPLDARNGEVSQKVVSVALMELVKSPVNEVELRRKTLCDPVLGVVLRRILEGGLSKMEGEQFKPFRTRHAELSSESGVVLWGARVVVPKDLQETVLNELHEVHPGMTRMKSLARSYVWWPGIDADIETMVRQCHVCQVNQSKPAVNPVHTWEFASEPWERLHIDHAGPINGDSFLIVVDSYSKWLEVERVKSTDAKTTCAVLRKLFATHGLPRVIVSDNGSGFASEEFNQFLRKNQVKHLYSAPYHPASNGQAERLVRTFKESLKTMSQSDDLQTRLCRLLFRYRITPHSLTGQSPSELLFRRRIRSPLSLLKPNLRGTVEARQASTESPGKHREFAVDDVVLVSNYTGGGKWIKGVVLGVKGSVNYEVKLMDGRVVHRHVNQMVRYCSGEPGGPPSSRLDEACLRIDDDVAASIPGVVVPAVIPPESMALPQGNGEVEVDLTHQSPPVLEEPVHPISPEVVARPMVEPVVSSGRVRPLPERRAPSERVRKKPAYLAEYDLES